MPAVTYNKAIVVVGARDYSDRNKKGQAYAALINKCSKLYVYPQANKDFFTNLKWFVFISVLYSVPNVIPNFVFR